MYILYLFLNITFFQFDIIKIYRTLLFKKIKLNNTSTRVEFVSIVNVVSFHNPYQIALITTLTIIA